MKTRSRACWYLALPILVLVACVLNSSPIVAQMTSTGINCSQIGALHLLEQYNMRAGLTLMECGVIPRPKSSGLGDAVDRDAPSPPNSLVSNRSCTSSSTCTKSESVVVHGTRGLFEIAVNYNDHNGNNYSGFSFSFDEGASFTQILPPPFATGHGTNYGNPILVFNSNLNLWFAGDLASACGGQGIGLWSSPDGMNWTPVAPCAHVNSADDRLSMWVDNDPASSKYGTMYISFNTFNGSVKTLTVISSTNGTTWSTLKWQPLPQFFRNVQITGGGIPTGSTASTVFIAAMDEGGGGLNMRRNMMFRLLNGTVTPVWMGSQFTPAGDGLCPSNPFFAIVNPIWRQMSWGQPAVGPNGVVHYAYAGHSISTPNDNGDIFYVRSADNGMTWSAPLQLNTDPDGQYKTQWMPSLSVNPFGKVTVSWYDRRSATSACNVVTDPGCSYERYGVQSPDNGVTWGPNFAISDMIIPQPAQDDPGVPPCFAGDFNYSTADRLSAFDTWTDGRVAVGGVQVQNVEFADIPAIPEP